MNSLLGIDDPEPFELINPQGRSELVLLCDHASNRVPTNLNNLGLTEEQLASHIGWDPGAALLARALSARLDASLLLSSYSRLVIDCNRPPTATDSIPTESDGTIIFGNIGLSAEATQLRRRTFFDPYHNAISQYLDARETRPTRLLSIHSFTPVLAGISRPWSVGVCYLRNTRRAAKTTNRSAHDPHWPAQWLSALRARSSGPVGDNHPYEIEQNVDYTLPVHGAARRIANVMLEFRQDKLASQRAALHWSDLITQCWLDIASTV